MNKKCSGLFLPYGGGLVLCIVFLLTSCENFMDENSLKERIDEQISYYNSQKTTVEMRLDTNDYGSIYPSIYRGIEGESFTVTYVKKKDVVFRYDWMCYDLSTEESTDAVLISDTTKVSENISAETETYTATVTIKKIVKNIVVMPYAYLGDETVPPKFKTLKIASCEDNLNKEQSLITKEAFVDYADLGTAGSSDAVDNNIKNHHVRSLWIEVDGRDGESGVSRLEVQERYIRQADGTERIINEQTDYESTVYYNSENTINYEKRFEHKFKTVSDGIINIRMILYDKADNTVTQELDVIKDTVCHSYVGFSMKKDEWLFADENNECEYEIIISPGYDTGVEPYATDMQGNAYCDKIWISGYDPEIDDSIQFEDCPQIVKFEKGRELNNLEEVDIAALPYDVSNVKYYSSPHTNLYGKYYTYSFTHNCACNTFIILTIRDRVGNEKESKLFIGKSRNMLSIDNTDSATWTFNCDIPVRQYTTEGGSGAGYLYFVYESPSGVKSKVANSYEYFTDSTASISKVNFQDIKSGGSQYVNLAALDDGIYYFYAGSYGSVKFPLGKPFVYYKGVTPPQSSVTELTQNSIPEFTLTVDDPVISTGKRTVRLKYAEGTVLDENLSYTVKYPYKDVYNTSNNKTMYTRETVFEVPSSLTKENFYLVVFNEAGESVTSAPVELDLTYDNVPPSFYYYLTAQCTYSDQVKMQTTLYDRGAGMQYEADGSITGFCYTSSKSNLTDEEIDWDNNSSVTRVKYYNGSIYVPFNGNFDNWVYVQFKDKNFNALTVSFKRPACPLNLTPVIDSDYNVSLNSSVPSSLYITYDTLQDSKWVNIKDKQSMTKSGTDFSYSLSLSESQKNNFVKVNCWYTAYTGSPNYGYFTEALYFYPPYIEDPGSMPCYLKSFQKCGENEIAVFADQPCMVQTLYCSVNQESALLWASRGVELKVETALSSFTYEVPYDEVPEKSFYVSVIHYADGTLKMTDVTFKP
jgi:hypothetical protein